MNIEKYNQRLLAVLGTVAIVFLVVALIAFISIMLMEYGRFTDNDVETGILSDEKIEELQKENKREQVISYETPKLIDTLNSVYIIPVSHKTLNEEEDLDTDGILNAYSSGSGFKSSSRSRRYSREYYGPYNNLIVYDPKNNTRKKLFDKRLHFNDIRAEYFEDDILLLMNVSEKDTYKDGIIDPSDFKSLYIYSLRQKELISVDIPGTDVFDYTFVNESKDLMIRFGVDKNDNGQYEEHNEPAIIRKYDFESGTLTDIVDEKMSDVLQKTLEGTKN